MQTLEVISINLWQILISLANLILLFLILKKFLFAPVNKVLEQRNAAVDEQYAAAAAAQEEAENNRDTWEQKLKTADTQAEAILQKASEKAHNRGDRIIAEAQEKADSILRKAEVEAELERKKAESDIKQEIVDVSAALAEKMLDREINTDDHRAMIDSFIKGLGE